MVQIWKKEERKGKGRREEGKWGLGQVSKRKETEAGNGSRIGEQWKGKVESRR